MYVLTGISRVKCPLVFQSEKWYNIPTAMEIYIIRMERCAVDKEKQKQLLFEFMRYVIVGGVAFVVDAGVMTLTKELAHWHLAVCVALGFAAGLLANYLLSAIFVFRTAEQKERSHRVVAFLIYATVGVIGLGLTELGMFIGVSIVGSDGFWYVLVKCFVAGVVLVWNYIGRKIFVYHGR